MLCNHGLPTDREVAANRPDILIENKKKKACMLVDVAMPADRNITITAVEKEIKHRSSCIEMQRVWYMYRDAASVVHV